jgi:hypothetical protein
MEFKRNEKTGILEIWKDGKKIGKIITMGDEIKNGKRDNNRYQSGKQ